MRCEKTIGGLDDAAGAARARRGAAAARAGFRRGHGAVRDRLRASCSSPARACATCWRLAAALCCALGAAGRVLAVPAEALASASCDPWADPFNSGFQLTQSLIAIGRGAWFGVGLGASVQKLFYLPEAHTDFVFAVLAEELGLVGVVGVIAAVPRAGLASVPDCAHGRGRGAEVPVLPRAGVRHVARRAGVRQHRRQHGRAADQGPDAAADELRPHQPARDAGLDRRAAARPSRGPVHVARPR